MGNVFIDKLEQLIKMYFELLEQSENDRKIVLAQVNGLIDCYQGDSLDNVYDLLLKQTNNLNKIKSSEYSYLKTLEMIKEAYIRQDKRFAEQLSKTIRKNFSNL